MSIALRFPCNMLVKVAPETRFEIFPSGDFTAYENVEYHIGDPSVCFVVKRTVVESQPRSFFGLQLTHRHSMSRDIQQEGEHNVIKVVLKDYNPMLFPSAFGYLNQVFTDPETATIPLTGLSGKEKKQVTQLVKGFLGVENPLQSLLFKARDQQFKANEVLLSANGRLTDSKKIPRISALPDNYGVIKATISQEGVITCVQSSPSVTMTMTINLHKIPTAAPWPRSIVEDDIIAQRKASRAYTKASEQAGEPTVIALPTVACDALTPIPETDDDLMPYPYLVDQKTSFFIPATAILCKMEYAVIACEGVYHCKEDRIRIESLDTQNYPWLWLEMSFV